jgi:hypothetical protein
VVSAPAHCVQTVDWTSRADFMAVAIVTSNFDGIYPVGTSEEARLCIPSQENRRSHDKTSSSFHNGRCQHVEACSTGACTLPCALKWTKDALNIYYN